VQAKGNIFTLRFFDTVETENRERIPLTLDIWQATMTKRLYTTLTLLRYVYINVFFNAKYFAPYKSTGQDLPTVCFQTYYKISIRFVQRITVVNGLLTIKIHEVPLCEKRCRHWTMTCYRNLSVEVGGEWSKNEC
jgi:hypothetical protein